ncbi:hypothetical protein [uncultured Duncaniella sp.]|uniref:hypothetical protein n=1 Tax=uncultured Duncaniella sp. TaxID=2768039 RepID=UPI002638B5A4|nr:hypothetical protein [uncultured Duncaniella sp.]
MLSWHIVTSEMYRLGTKVDGDLYFLSDTKEIYRGTECFSEAAVLYTEEPVVKATGKIYFDATTLEGKMWNGTAWNTVIRPIMDTVDPESLNGVSSKAIAAYVAAEIAKVPTVENAIIDLTWDADNKMLTYTQDGTVKNLPLGGIAVSMASTAQDGKTVISLLDVNGNVIGNSVSLDLERFVTGAEYDVDSQSIIMYFDGKTGEESTDKLVIPVGDLVDVYTVESSETLTLEMENNIIKGSLKISSDPTNAIVVKPDGIYVPVVDVSDKMDLVDGATEGNIAVFGTGGQAIDSGLTKDKIIEAAKAKVYVGATMDDILAAVATDPAAQGDIAIISERAPGTAEKYNRKAYIYDEGKWVPMSGNWAADEVYLKEDLIITSELPGITLVNGNATVAKAGAKLNDVLTALFMHERSPQTTAPALTVELPQAGEYEVGTTVTPSFTATLSTGSYEFGPNPTGVNTTSWNASDSNGGTIMSNTGTFDAFNVAEGTNYAVTVINQYSAGQIPVTNLGNEYADGKIGAGTLTAVSRNITGYRAAFGGAKTVKDAAEIDSAYIRALTTKVKPAIDGSFDVTVPAGTLRVVVAIPGTFRDPKAIKDGNAMGLNIISNFKSQTVSVEGANGYIAVPYKVYVLDMAAASLQDNVYTVIM